MAEPSKGDRVVLHATNIPGFLCQSGFECVFDSMVRNRFKCLLPVQPATTIIIHRRHIAAIYSKATGALIYKHDKKDCL